MNGTQTRSLFLSLHDVFPFAGKFLDGRKNQGRVLLNGFAVSRGCWKNAVLCSTFFSLQNWGNEYIIKTIEPEQGLYGKVLQARIERIKENNRKPDQLGHVYCRPIKEVEAEIAKRQSDCSGGFAPAQPQKPQQQAQARHARQVPVPGNCPKCHATNPRSAKFCNQCGAKLT
jgi:zinc-ribbon domain